MHHNTGKESHLYLDDRRCQCQEHKCTTIKAVHKLGMHFTYIRSLLIEVAKSKNTDAKKY